MSNFPNTGEGAPFVEPQHDNSHPIAGNDPNWDGAILTSPNGGNPTTGTRGNSNNQRKIRRIVVDLTFAFSRQYNIAGTIIWFTGQTGGTMAPMQIILGNPGINDAIDFIYGRAISGIPFDRFTLINTVNQPGVSAVINVFDDTPSNRVGLEG